MNEALPLSSIARTVKINQVLNEVEQAIIADGGSLEVHSIEDKIIKVSLKGACATCPSSQMTIKFGIEKRLQQEVDPEICVEAV